MSRIPELFGSMVFNDTVMKERLPKETYKALQKTISEGKDLDISVANVVATAMRDWAVSNGATHYTHWFQPMTGVTAEKHDSFISPTGGGNIIMEFSGKELIKGEPDASSFPSGGLRATFEARGYTSWDPTSYAFIKENTLCIPTAFCSYSGEALDKKTPLLKSMEAIDKQAKRIMKLFGKNVKRVLTTVGPEQEYFLISQEMYDARPDIQYTGRTLFGAKPPKGQEMDDHYFGAIKPRVHEYMMELDDELWKLGILAKTEHNEVAPAQHELAPIYSTTNIATDHNQLTMELMKKVATRHGMACLLHEKPFAGVNGSGKHNNWAISTDDGKNLLDPGDNPEENAQFLLFLCAVIKAVDKHQDLMRLSVASAGNDHRLGANEAPPAIISMFVGDDLGELLRCIETGDKYKGDNMAEMEIAVHVLPNFPKDTTDRNRTSPFAFTGNKFEFRMLGSSLSIADPNLVLNTIVAESLDSYATELENVPKDQFKEALNALVRRTIRDHKRIVFNGNNYSDEWVVEAEKRGLLNLKSTVDALPYLEKQENIDLFEKYNVFTEAEIRSRYEIMMENYAKTINIEALTMLEMAKRDILPAELEFVKSLADSAASKQAMGIDVTVEMDLAGKLTELTKSFYGAIDELEQKEMKGTDMMDDAVAAAKYYHSEVLLAMNELRALGDQMEVMTSSEYWPYPSYGEMLFSVK
ncbi:MAG: glutamine synthetase type III [Clostridiales bacterium]|nr:MAG: glutamine synthetase type III [Clostridiales bacterium]